MRSIRCTVALLLSVACVGVAVGQDLSSLSFSVSSAVDVPIGNSSALFDDTSGTYKLGVSGMLRGQYAVSDAASIGGSVRYGRHPTFAGPLSIFSFGPSGGMNLRLGDFLGLHVGAEAGLSLGFFGSHKPPRIPTERPWPPSAGT